MSDSGECASKGEARRRSTPTWYNRIEAGIAGARPALPNKAPESSSLRRNLAHLLRRVARVMIRQSNKLDPPHHDHVHMGVNGGVQYGIDCVRRMDTTNQFQLRYHQ